MTYVAEAPTATVAIPGRSDWVVLATSLTSPGETRVDPSGFALQVTPPSVERMCASFWL